MRIWIQWQLLLPIISIVLLSCVSEQTNDKVVTGNPTRLTGQTAALTGEASRVLGFENASFHHRTVRDGNRRSGSNRRDASRGSRLG